MKTGVRSILLALLYFSIQAELEAQLAFTTNNGAVSITGYTGSNDVVVIPGTMAGLPVTAIGEWAFYSASIVNVLVPDSVTNIGDGAFFDCESLTNVSIGNSVVNIGDWAFAFCPGLTTLCFRGDAPNLGGSNVFYGDLATLYYLSGTTNWGPLFDGHPAVLWNPSVPFNYTTNKDTIIITGYTGVDGTLIVPTTINFLPVTSIGGQAFCGYSNLTNAVIPNSVTSIGTSAFQNCTNLTGVTIGNCVTNIGDQAFYNCSQLSSVEIGSSINTIGAFAFYGCLDLANIVIPNGVTAIGDGGFCYCPSLTSITIPNSVTDLEGQVFCFCSSLTNAVLPNTITNIQLQTFAWSGLTSFTIPESVALIGEQAFAGCSALTTITIPNNVTDIGMFAFEGCSGLTNLIMGTSLISIEQAAFDYCSSLTSFHFLGNAPSLSPAYILEIEYGAAIGASGGIVYYLPGTTNWTSNFGGLATALWLPQIQMTGISLGVQTNAFGFSINWASGHTVIVEASSDLENWQPDWTNTLLNGSTFFADSQWTNYSKRFYRIGSP